MTNCSISFILRFLEDLDTTSVQRGEILFKLSRVEFAYNQNIPTNSLNEISDKLYNCVKPYLNESAIITAEELGKLIIYLVILTAILIIVIVIIFNLLKGNPTAILVLTVVAAFSYVIIGVLIILNTLYIISNSISDTQNKIINCVDNAITELILLEKQEELAINKALCAY